MPVQLLTRYADPAAACCSPAKRTWHRPSPRTPRQQHPAPGTPPATTSRCRSRSLMPRCANACLQWPHPTLVSDLTTSSDLQHQHQALMHSNRTMCAATQLVLMSGYACRTTSPTGPKTHFNCLQHGPRVLPAAAGHSQGEARGCPPWHQGQAAAVCGGPEQHLWRAQFTGHQGG